MGASGLVNKSPRETSEEMMKSKKKKREPKGDLRLSASVTTLVGELCLWRMKDWAFLNPLTLSPWTAKGFPGRFFKGSQKLGARYLQLLKGHQGDLGKILFECPV